VFPCLYCHQPVYEHDLSEGLDGEGGRGEILKISKRENFGILTVTISKILIF
jgi:hypothetical protein